MIMRCRACSHYIHPPVRFCPACESRDTVPVAVSGRATIHSFTVNHKAWLPGLAVPYVLALVELSEQAGLYLPTNIIGCDPETVRIGMEVRSEEHTSELQSLMRISNAVFCLKKTKNSNYTS